MALPARTWRLSIIFACILFAAQCPSAWAEGLPCPTGRLTLASPLIGHPSSAPPILLAQNVIREARTAEPEEESEGSEKSPGKAFVFSMLAPGSGQLYVGAKRGYIYLGVEAIAWTSSYFLWKSGKQKKDEYEDFADNHWDFPVAGQDSCYYEEADQRLREFYEHDKEHFYEDIGKYAYYICGWDSDESLKTYVDMRDDSNRLLKGSNYAIMAAVINHVVSAIDALRLARNYNMTLSNGVKLDLKFKGSPESPGLMLVASSKF
jgi:hypothetical protein